MTGADEMAGTSETEFEARTQRLDALWDDWTGMSDVEGRERAVQSDGSPVIHPGIALSTLVVYAAQMAHELGVGFESFSSIAEEVYDGLDASEEDEDEGGADSSSAAERAAAGRAAVAAGDVLEALGGQDGQDAAVVVLGPDAVGSSEGREVEKAGESDGEILSELRQHFGFDS